MKPTLPIFILALLPSLSFAAGPRAEISLNGEWEYQRVEQLETLPGSGDWKPSGSWSGGPTTRIGDWCRACGGLFDATGPMWFT